MPADQLLPTRRTTSRSTSPSRCGDGRRRLHDRPRAAARDRRPRRRGARPVRGDDPAAAPGLQRADAHDPPRRPAGARRGAWAAAPRSSAPGSTSSASAPARPDRAARLVAPQSAPAAPRPRLRSTSTCQHRRRPRSRSSSRATTSWWACSASATSCCASSRPRSPCTIHVRGNEITVTGDDGRRRARRPALRGAGRAARAGPRARPRGRRPDASRC